MTDNEKLLSLNRMQSGQSGTIASIQGGYGIISTLKSLGITPGKRITRISPVPVQGPITIEMDKVQICVGFGMASRIMVKAEEKLCDH